MLGTLNPEDPDYTINSKGIYATMEQMAAAKNQALLQAFTANAQLIEKLLLGTKLTMTSKSDIGSNLKNLITNLRSGSSDLDRMIREATKKLQSSL